MANFQDILSKPSAAIEAPKALPPGTYLCIVEGQPAFSKVGQNQTDVVDFILKPMQAQGDVDADALAACLAVKDAAGNVIGAKPLADRKIRHRLFVTEDSVYRVKNFLDHCDVEEGTRSLGERIPMAMGKQVLATMGHKSSNDGTQIYGEVKSTAKV